MFKRQWKRINKSGIDEQNVKWKPIIERTQSKFKLVSHEFDILYGDFVFRSLNRRYTISKYKFKLWHNDNSQSFDNYYEHLLRIFSVIHKSLNILVLLDRFITNISWIWSISDDKEFGFMDISFCVVTSLYCSDWVGYYSQ